MDHVKTYLSANVSANNKTIKSTLGKIYYNKGLSGFYRGLILHVTMSCVYYGIPLALFDTAKPHLPKVIPEIENFFLGAACGLVGNALSFPLDLVKRRLQISGLKRGFPSVNSTRKVAKTLYKREGVVGFYRGLGPSTIRTLPMCGLLFMGNEAIKNFLGYKG